MYRIRFAVLPFLIFVVLILNSGCFHKGDDDPQQETIVEPKIVISPDIAKAFNLDPNKKDTDGDGLSDVFELTYAFPILQPDILDTDGNGINDGEEDTDGDGLSNIQEQELNTSPLEQDSDSDFLSDEQEVNLHKTNPLLADTDGDGILDGREIINGSDPLLADAERSVISKNVITTTNHETGQKENIKIAITGQGDLSSKIIIRNWSDSKAVGQVGRSFDISLPPEDISKMESVEITLPFDVDDSQITDESQLSIFTISPDTNFWEELPSQVNITDSTVTATTTHFSPFQIADSNAFNESLDNIPSTCDAIDDPNAAPVDVVLAIDSSGSMEDNDPNNLRITASRNFVQVMKSTDRVAIVDFDSYAALWIGLSNNQDAIFRALSRIDSYGGTDIGFGVNRAIGELINNSDASINRAIILLTDGIGDYNHNFTTRMADENIRAFTIGLTGEVDGELLQSIADGTNGTYKKINDADGLISIFEELSTVFGDDGTDDDEDGLTNCQEVQGFYLPKSGGLIHTDPKNPDTDGDGVSDGAEVGSLEHGTNSSTSKIIWVAKNPSSNPTKVDTDGDTILDPDEYRLTTDAFSRDTDNDAITDNLEINTYETDPTNPDSDGDGLTDTYEILNSAEGFDPNIFDYKANWKNRALFMAELSKGAVLGDIIDIDTSLELYGQIAGGFFVITDVRDFVANIFKGEWISAGISAVSIIPLIGDVGGAGLRVAKFLEKFSRARYEVIRLLNKHFDEVARHEVIGIRHKHYDNIDWVKKYLPTVPEKSASWALKPFARGKALEKPIGDILKKDDEALIGLYGNFPKIDMWNPVGGKAVSIKTLDLDAKTYQNVSAFKSKINRYAKELNGFEKASGKSIELNKKIQIKKGEVGLKELVMGFPRSLDNDFVKIIDEIVGKHGIKITSIVAP